MVPKMNPLYDSLALSGPLRGPPWAAPAGTCLSAVSIPSPGGEPRSLPANAHERPERARREGTLVEDGLLTQMGSIWVESGAWRRRMV